MTPQFLRSEAARFRDMAETADREASKARLLAMALDYDARANAADGGIVAEEVPAAEAATAPEAVAEPEQPEVIKGRSGRLTAKNLKTATI